MTDEEAADILKAVVVFDDDPAALEPYRRAVAALRGRKTLVDALEGVWRCIDAEPEIGTALGEVAADVRAALETVKNARAAEFDLVGALKASLDAVTK